MLDSMEIGKVSIHAPREGCDTRHGTSKPGDRVFQFTHPGRGATALCVDYRLSDDVSIHAPREGCDAK